MSPLIIAIISTLISSIALAGVAISLLLQSRQLRISQLQAANSAQLELIKMALDNPSMASEVLGVPDSDLYAKQVFLNWHIKYLELGYEINAISATGVRQAAEHILATQTALEWWSWNRQLYLGDTTTRRTKQFFAIIDAEFQHLKTASASSASPTNPQSTTDETAGSASS
jgi:hypothetical protein